MNSLSFGNTRWSTQRIATLGLLVSLSILLDRFSLGPAFLEVRVGFIATALMGYYLGPWQAALGGFIADYLNTLLNGQTYTPTFALTAVFAAAVYGVFLYRRPVALWRVFAAVTVVIFIANIVMNTTWLALLGYSWQAIIASRAVKNLLMWPLQTALLYALLRAVERVRPAR